MLDSETKRRIDTARDILVGKVPDPKSQVEQITIALIYKFMDDMDAQSEEFGGKRTFFAGEFERYGWAKLMRSGLGGFEMLNLYSEAIAKMPENPGIPLLFRNIFKNAYLPYRDPETLRAFLKIIDDFSYDHSERLGDAFEYLLSVLGSQGDAGQFRTPRHIIDFMVAVLDPKKTETVLDPACGTAGFLISSYKHILEANKDANGNTNLTPDERERLVRNFRGYDISPDMVRLSLVNLYLHGFVDPNIAEYDTLTSQDKWNEFADVILANPPFMSPKGGIRPHKRFSVQSNRSEVLFVDYIAEHLTPTGRAGIIVPEGIIFQSQNAYKLLRKMLVEDFLVAVVSLPAGMFNPYSGVKTSILILDKTLAKRSGTVAFFKIEKDGYGLGAQRRALCSCNGDKPELCPEHSDIPRSHREIAEYLRRLRTGEAVEDFQPTLGLVVGKEKVAANGDYNLSGERYRETEVRGNSKWPKVYLEEVADLIGGYAFKSAELRDSRTIDTERPVIKIGNLMTNGKINCDDVQYFPYYNGLNKYVIQPQDILVAMTGATVGKSAIAETDGMLLNQRVGIVRANGIAQNYLAKLLLTEHFYSYCQATAGGGAQGNISPNQILQYQIPLPPLEVQQEIVAEIEGYQKVIDGARQVVESYKPVIIVDPDWPMVDLDEICTIVRGSSPRPQGDPKYFGGPIPRLMVADITRDGMYSTPRIDSLTEEGATKSRPMKQGDVIITVSGNPGLPTILAVDACIHDGFVGLRNLSQEILPTYMYFALLALHFQHGSQAVGAVFKNLTTDQISKFKIAKPSIEIQQALVAEIEAEQALVAGNRELIERFEKKIQDTLARVWGEAEQTPIETRATEP